MHDRRTARPDAATGALLVAVSATAFGAMPIFGTWAYDDGTSLWALLVVRFSLAAVLLGVAVRLRGGRLPERRRVAVLAAMGGLGYVGQAFCYFTALQYASASLVVLLLYLFPAFVAVLAAVVFRERLTAPVVVALLLVLAGTGLVVGGGSGSAVGIAFGVGAALVYAVYITVGTVATRGLDPLVVTAIVCAAAAVSTGAVALAQAAAGEAPVFPASWRGWSSLVAIAVVSTVVAILTFFAGLQRLGPTRASVLSTLEPVVTVVLAAALLGEVLGPVQMLGGLLVLAAVAWQATARAPVAAEGVPPV